MSRYDVIVVGLGAMGSMAAYQLAKRGVSVLGLDQFAVPHRWGSSGGGSRMVRKIYHEHPDYVPLLDRAFELWRELESETGIRFLFAEGGLYIGEPDCDSISGAIRMAERFKMPHDVLSVQQIAERFPPFVLPDAYIGLFEPTAGWIDPERAISAACHAAMRCGAVLHGYEPVPQWSSDSSGIAVTAPAATYRADKIVLCGGPWMSQLAPCQDLSLWVSRQVTGWLCPRDSRAFQADRFPVWSFRRKDGTRLYGFPMQPGTPGLKVANHDRSQVTTADGICREIMPGDEDSFRQGLQTLLPGANGALLSIDVCMYSNSADLDFVVGAHPENERAIVACGFSGHGFKFASVIGAILADFALTGRTDLPTEFLSPKRFA